MGLEQAVFDRAGHRLYESCQLSADESRRVELAQQLKDKLANIEGVETVLEPAQFEKLGLPRPDANPESPHLILTTNPGYSFDGGLSGAIVSSADGLKGSHGHDPSP